MDETGMTPRIVVTDDVDAHIVVEALASFGNDIIDAFATKRRVTESDLLSVIEFTDRITALIGGARPACCAGIARDTPDEKGTS